MIVGLEMCHVDDYTWDNNIIIIHRHTYAMVDIFGLMYLKLYYSNNNLNILRQTTSVVLSRPDDLMRKHVCTMYNIPKIPYSSKDQSNGYV